MEKSKRSKGSSNTAHKNTTKMSPSLSKKASITGTASPPGNPVNTPHPPHVDNGKSTTFYGRLYAQAKRFRKYLATQTVLVIPALVLMLLGFKDLPKSVPLFDLINRYPVATPAIGGVLALFSLALLIISFIPEPKNDKKGPNTGPNRKWIIATTISTVSSLISSLLLAVVLIRPPGCPTFLCASPQIIPRVVTSSHSVHDDNLEVYPVTLQNTSFVIPGDPAQYSQNDLPQTIGAIRLDKKPSVSLYRIVIGVHSLQQGRYGVLITHVGLEILQTPPTPRPLNVWNKGSTIDYHTNPYSAVYSGELPGSIIFATYTPFPHANVSLVPGEADQLDIQVNSHVLANIQFRIQITYRITNKSRLRLLTLPDPFEVVFSNASNWYTYQLQSGHFVISP